MKLKPAKGLDASLAVVVVGTAETLVVLMVLSLSLNWEPALALSLSSCDGSADLTMGEVEKVNPPRVGLDPPAAAWLAVEEMGAKLAAVGVVPCDAAGLMMVAGVDTTACVGKDNNHRKKILNML